MSEPTQDLAAEQQRIAVQWLAITIERWRANIKKLKIGSTQELYNSFQGDVVGAAAGDELKLRLAYALQGMYVDMGVGRGMGAGVSKKDSDYRRFRNDKGKLHRHMRRAKRWHTKQLANEQHRLGYLMSDATGRTLIALVHRGLPEQLTINI